MAEEKEKKPTYMYLFLKHIPHLLSLTNEQIGNIFRYVLTYADNYSFTEENDNKPPFTAVGENKLAQQILVDSFTSDIQNAFNKYHIKSENGKKGGAPKGNKNAVKKKPLKTFSSDDEYYIGQLILYMVSLEIHEDYNFIENYGIAKMSTILSCFEVVGVESYKEFVKYTNKYLPVSFKDYTLNNGEVNCCKEIESLTKNYDSYLYEEHFKDYKKIASKLLKIPLDELSEMVDNYSLDGKTS
jgi:hypothetical protein